LHKGVERAGRTSAAHNGLKWNIPEVPLVPRADIAMLPGVSQGTFVGVGVVTTERFAMLFQALAGCKSCGRSQATVRLPRLKTATGCRISATAFSGDGASITTMSAGLPTSTP
jgi:hypothetical protein